MSDDIQVIEAPDRAAFRAWLEENHATENAVWLIFWKKGSGRPSIEWADAVDEALCFGWIDSKVQSIDDSRYRQYWTVRKPGSTWSKINKDKVARLSQQGRMAPSGLAAVERAKQDGSWTILDGPEAGIVPDDLGTAMDATGVREAYNALAMGARKAILAWLAMAKRDTTRANRIAKTIEALQRGESPLG
ncbi:MAG: YdeI/OmpD-associated family protein [Acidimicrobiia bacterium]|nr:YdeI/OmpD-associated family protein [Acidimicrobiia bacterium]